MSSHKDRGFTLIELLVVIAIIGILSSVVLASLNSARKKGRDARRISDVKQLQLALELYYDANQRFPTHTEAFANATTSVLVTNKYISSLPLDPTTLAAYSYSALDDDGTTACTTSSPGCPSYVIGADIEGGQSAVPAGDVDGADVGGIDCSDNGATARFCVMP
jgi:type II secretion system protein G